MVSGERMSNYLDAEPGPSSLKPTTSEPNLQRMARDKSPGRIEKCRSPNVNRKKHRSPPSAYDLDNGGLPPLPPQQLSSTTRTTSSSDSDNEASNLFLQTHIVERLRNVAAMPAEKEYTLDGKDNVFL
ncbi:hypothetical protein AAVH_06312 [Aphelenchoides avenae]|nr:hypothetical protein AAVH_06312 [Aphelenchus avenae]